LQAAEQINEVPIIRQQRRTAKPIAKYDGIEDKAKNRSDYAESDVENDLRPGNTRSELSSPKTSPRANRFRQNVLLS
jgi:hypothetical protein